jgi:glycosyltransferase involved in cell wall biosynthesis
MRKAALMPKIVIDARQYTTTTGRYAFRLVQCLEKIDQNNDYVILLKPEDMNVYDFTNPRFSKVVCSHQEFTLDEQRGLLKQVNGLHADLVHFAIVQQPILYRGKVVTTMHDLTTTRFKNPDKKRTVYAIKQLVYRYITKRVAKKSVAIITPTQFVKSDLVDFTHVNPDKITVTYEAADPIKVTPIPLPDLQNKQFIMYVGRPTPHKNLERLISVLPLLRAQHPNLTLVLAGKKDGNYQRIEAALGDKLREHVYFTDFVSEGQLRWLYEHCAAYVFPSLSEGFGLPGLEAMIHGAPVVSSNATCLPEVYGDAAHYFDPLNIQSMVDAINEVLSDQVLRQKLIQAGREQVNHYSWKRMAEQTLAIYDQVLAAK